MTKMRTILQGVVGIIMLGLYAASGGFPRSTWEMGRVIQSNEWGWYLSIIGIIKYSSPGELRTLVFNEHRLLVK